MENSSRNEKLKKIIEIILGGIDFEGGIIDYNVSVPDEGSDDPRFEIYLIFSSDWLNDNYGVAPMYVRRTKKYVYDKIKEITGQDVFIGNYVQ